MRRHFLLALVLALLAPMHSNAQQNSCPWINDATAAGVLETNVQTSVQGTTAKGMSCTFKGVEQSDTRSLVIEVRAIGNRDRSFAEGESHCASPATPVKGLGNEAFECVTDHAGSHGMMMIGRVRDTLFVVNVIMPMQREQGTTGQSLKAKLAIAAGQVVGNLF